MYLLLHASANVKFVQNSRAHSPHTSLEKKDTLVMGNMAGRSRRKKKKKEGGQTIEPGAPAQLATCSSVEKKQVCACALCVVVGRYFRTYFARIPHSCMILETVLR